MIKNTAIKFFILGSLFASATNAEQLTATIIGSGSPQYDENRGSASVLISAGDTKILVDMGNGTQATLHELGTRISDISALVFTHHHLDHNEEFVPILIQELLGRDDFSIVGPPDTTKFTDVNIDLYGEDISYRLSKSNRTIAERKDSYEVTDIQGGESFNIGDVNVSTVEVPHTIHTIAYRFDYNGESIVVTGDLTYTDDLPPLAKNADFMIIDSGGMVMTGGKRGGGKKGGGKKGDGSKGKRQPAHLNLADSSLLAKKSNVKNLVYTHFTPGTVNEEASLKKIRENYTGNVIFGEDLMVIKNTESSNISASSSQNRHSYEIVDTGQKKFYSNNKTISLPADGDDFYGQDGTYIINDPSYTDNNDGTITDNVTGLMWQQDMGDKLSFDEAKEKAKSFELAGYTDWRVATLKETYSLIQFTGTVMGESVITPFIDTEYFNQPIGGANPGEREIDAQTWSSTEYVGKTMNKDDTVFGVNFVDGRIKGYPKFNPRTQEPNKMYFRLVRGNKDYGKNSFVDNGDNTITDEATGLMWQKADSKEGLNWEDSLEYSENLTLGGHSDWRLPNAKELQSIVDYTRSPETSDSAAIDPIFQTSTIQNEGGEKDYPYFWSSSTHLDGPVPQSGAAYLAFGKAMGKMRGTIMDVHGAGAQRSDPKTGEPMSRGPQGDMLRVKNYVRSVRGGVVTLADSTSTEHMSQYSDGQNKTPSMSKNEPSKGKKDRPSRSQGNKFITRLDKDGDSKVSSSEFKGPKEHFAKFDKNNDGFITADEAPTGPPKNKK